MLDAFTTISNFNFQFFNVLSLIVNGKIEVKRYSISRSMVYVRLQADGRGAALHQPGLVQLPGVRGEPRRALAGRALCCAPLRARALLLPRGARLHCAPPGARGYHGQVPWRRGHFASSSRLLNYMELGCFYNLLVHYNHRRTKESGINMRHGTPETI